jgi:astacin
MANKPVAVLLVAFTIGVASLSGASPKGPDSGLFTRLTAIEATGEQQSTAPDEYGAVRALPSIPADSVLPAETSEDGGRFTLLRFSASSAAGIRLHFANLRLSNDARVYVYGLSSEGGVTDIHGPYIGAGPVQSGDFWTPVIRGSEAVVEIQFDRAVPADLPFEVIEIGALSEDLLAAAPAVSNSFDSGLPANVKRSMFQGVVVEHEVREGMAVVEGDIILGAADDMQPASVVNTKPGAREGTATSWVSSRWPNGIMPYAIDPALPNQQRVIDAVNHWNTALNGIVRLVPRTTESNYVLFGYTSNASFCASNVGMSGGVQTTYLGDYCSSGNIVHEIGHDWGLWHEHTRNDRDTYVTVATQNITPSALSNFVQTGTNGVDVGAYDYNSIMHYPSYAFSANGQPTIITKPDGIPIGQRSGLSTGDIAAISQIYGGTRTVQNYSQSIVSNPAGIKLVVDGTNVSTPYTVQWTAGSSHSISAPNPAPANGQKLVYSSWSDGGSQTHTVSASSSTSVLTASYVVSYLLTAQVSPAGTGSVSINPLSTDGYYAANSTVSLSANPAPGYCFSSWTGLLSGTPAQTSLTITKTYSLVANFRVTVYVPVGTVNWYVTGFWSQRSL